MDASMMKCIFIVVFFCTTLGKSKEQRNKIFSQRSKLNTLTISPVAEVNEANKLATTSALTPATTPDGPYSVTDLKVSDTKENSISLVNVTFKYRRVATGAIDHFVITYKPLNNTESWTTCQSIEPYENITGITVEFENKTTFSQLIPVTADTQYRLTVKAFNGYGNSIHTINFTERAKASDQVTKLNVTGVTSSSAQVQWSPPRYPKGNILAYEVRVKNNNKSCTVKLMCSGNRENYVQPSPECQLFSVKGTADTITENQVIYRLNSLTPYNDYSVDVSVINSYGKGYNSTKHFNTSESAPESVQSLKVSAVNDNSSQAEVTFNCPLTSNGKITYYSIMYEALNNTNTSNRCQSISPTENKTGKKVQAEESHSCSYSVLVPVTADTRYIFKVFAVNKYEGMTSNKSYVAKTNPSDPVTDLKVTHVTSTNATVLWLPPLNSRGNILSYEIKWSSNEGCGRIQLTCKGNDDHDEKENTEFSLVNVSPECTLPNENTAGTFTDKQLTYLIVGLTPYTNYSVDVLVKTSYGKSDISGTQFKTSESEPESVRKLNVSEVLNISSQAEVSFQCPHTSNGKINYYWIMYEALENTLTTNPCQTIDPIENRIGIRLPAVESQSCNYSVTVQVTEETQYLFKVFAVNTFNGTSLNMTYRSKAGVPGKVVGLNVTQLDTNYTAATVSFYSPQNPNGIITKYVLSYFMMSPGYTDSACEVLRQITNMTAITIYANSTENCLYSKTVAISPETTYSIQVAAFNSHKGRPAEIHYTTSSSVPGSIKAIKIYNVTCDSVMVTWEHPSQPNGFLKGYRLQLNRIEPNIEECFKAAELSCKGETISDVPTEAWCNTDRIVNAHMEVSDPLSYQFKGLFPFTSYELIIKAVNRNGSGESSSVHFNTAQLAPGPVTSLSFSSVPGNFSDLNLHFTCLAFDKRHGNITHYTIKYIADTKMSESKCGMSPVIQNTSGVIIDDDGSCSFSRRVAVTPERHYNFSIQAFNSLPGKIAFYEMSTPYGSPDEVRELKAVAITSSSVTVQWATPQHVNGMIHSYQLSVVLEGKCIFRQFTDCGDFNVNQENRKLKKECKTNGTTPSIKNFIHHKDLHNITVNDLLSYTKYTISVVPKNTNGSGPEALLNFMTNVGAPGPVKLLKIRSHTNSSATIQWETPQQVNGMIHSYQLTVELNGECIFRYFTDCGDFNPENKKSEKGCRYNNTTPTINKVTNNKDLHYITVHDLLSYTNYTVSVVPINRHGSGPEERVHFMTDVGEPVKVENLTVTPIIGNYTAATVSFSSPKNPNGVITHYMLSYFIQSPGHTNPACEVVTQITNRTGIQLHVHADSKYNGLYTTAVEVSPETTYIFKVTAFHSLNGPSTDINYTTGSSVPGPIRELQIHNVTSDSVLVTWKPPAQPNGFLKGYRLILNRLQLGTDDECYKAAEISCSGEKIGDVPTEAWCERDRIGNAHLEVNDPLSYQFTGLLPNTSYGLISEAVNIIGSGESSSVHFNTEPPDPPKEISKEIVIASETSGSTTDSTFLVHLKTDIMIDSKNGHVVMIGLLVMKDKAFVDVPNNVSSLKNWRGWREWKRDYKGTYRPTPDNWLIPQIIMRRSSTDNYTQSTIQFIVGADANCENIQEVHCNGPLKADTTYRIIAVTCTNAGCSSSTPFGPFITKVTPSQSFVLAVVVGVLAALVGIVIGVLVYRRQRKRNSVEEKEGRKSVDKNRPKRLCDFSRLVDEYRKDSGLLFSLEWREISCYSPSHTYNNAKLPVNRLKNRKTNILAYDHTRVKLLSRMEGEGSDYINANYIPGFSRPREYIASQGPMPGTVDDFWQMIWEQNVTIIVQLTDLYEKGQRKRSQYWPEEVNGIQTYGDVKVEIISILPMNKYTSKVFRVSLGSQSRQLKHFFLQGWPHYNTNLKTGDVIDFTRWVRNDMKSTDKGPMLVHSSAGSERTGMFISVDYFLQVIDKADLKDSIDIFSFVLKMRNCRPMMVQFESQYIFIHDAVKEMIERKKKALAGEEDALIYENQAFDPNEDFDDHIYESI